MTPPKPDEPTPPDSGWAAVDGCTFCASARTIANQYWAERNIVGMLTTNILAAGHVERVHGVDDRPPLDVLYPEYAKAPRDSELPYPYQP